MKRIIIALTVAALVLGFSACNEKNGNKDKNDSVAEDVVPTPTEPENKPAIEDPIDDIIDDAEDMLDPDNDDYAEDGIIDDDGVEDGVIPDGEDGDILEEDTKAEDETEKTA